MFNQLLNLLERYYVYLHLCLLRSVRSKIIHQAFLSFCIKWRKSAGNDHIIAELIRSAGKSTRSEIHRHNCIWNKAELPRQWKLSIIVPLCEKGVNEISLQFSRHTIWSFI